MIKLVILKKYSLNRKQKYKKLYSLFAFILFILLHLLFQMSCYVGKLLGLPETCDNDPNTSVKISDIEEYDLQLLTFRVQGFQTNTEESICSNHYSKFLRLYSGHYKSCCDPFNIHQNTIKANLTVLTLDQCQKLKFLNNNTLIPGRKVCSRCNSLVNKEINENDKCCDPFKHHRNPVLTNLTVLDENICHDYLVAFPVRLMCGRKLCTPCFQKVQSDISDIKKNNEPVAQKSVTYNKLIAEESPIGSSSTPLESQGSNYQTISQQHQHLNNMFENLGLSPLVRDRCNDDKLKKKAMNSIQNVIEVFTSSISKVFDIPLPTVNYVQSEINSASFKSMIQNLQSRYNQETKMNMKINLLTLLPDNWKYENVLQYFLCSRYMWSTAMRIRESIGKNLRKNIFIIIYNSLISDVVSLNTLILRSPW